MYSKKGPHSPSLYILNDPQEVSFYNLGLKDRESELWPPRPLKDIVNSKLPIEGFFQTGSSYQIQKILNKSKDFLHIYNSYAEGLNIPLKQLIAHLLYLEVVNLSPTLFTNQRLRPFYGFDLFYFDHIKEHVVHTHSINSPLSRWPSLKETHFILSPPDMDHSIWYPGHLGLPFPLFRAYSSKGFSIGVHSKELKRINIDGHLISDIILHLLNECDELNQVKTILKKYPSISCWGINICDLTGKTLDIILNGKEIKVEESHLIKDPFHYIPHHPVTGHRPCSKSGHPNYFEELDQEMDAQKVALLYANSEQSQKSLPFFPKENHFSLYFNQLSLNSVNLSTEQIYTLPFLQKFSGIDFIELTNPWDHQPSWKESISTQSTKNSKRYFQGLKHLGAASYDYNTKQLQESYHHIQMSIDLLEGHQEQHIAHFYFLVFQYISSENEFDWPMLLTKFQEISTKLPPLLQEHCYLFEFRLKKLLNIPQKKISTRFNQQKLKRLYQLERKLPGMAINKMRKAIIPQIDVQDIFYLF